jgi:hypothetical protein
MRIVNVGGRAMLLVTGEPSTSRQLLTTPSAPNRRTSPNTSAVCPPPPRR